MIEPQDLIALLRSMRSSPEATAIAQMIQAAMQGRQLDIQRGMSVDMGALKRILEAAGNGGGQAQGENLLMAGLR